MKTIEPAEQNTFKLLISRAGSGVQVTKKGKIRITDDGELRLDYLNNTDSIGFIENDRVTIITNHRNLCPLYTRIYGEQIWISNDLTELINEGETIQVRKVELLFAAAGSEGIRSAFSHLVETIKLLLPSSRYVMKFNESTPSIFWSDIDFDFFKNANKETFLELYIKQYEKIYRHDNEICLALSGGYDSRLDLAILCHLKKKVNCYHYITSTYEAERAQSTSDMCGSTFSTVPGEDTVIPGWNFLKDYGYLTRWDGFFAAGTLYSVGLYLKMMEDHPEQSKLLMSFGSLRGRLYEHSSHILDYWIEVEEANFIKCSETFPEECALIRSEVECRKEKIPPIVESLRIRCPREDIAMDIAFGMLSRQGKLATRSTFLFENGMPFISVDKSLRNYFMSLPQRDKESTAFLEWAINTINPDLNKIARITSSMSYAEREYGPIGRIPLLGGFLSLCTRINNGYRQDWYHDTDVLDIFNQVPEIKKIGARARGDKSKMYIAQICRFLKAIQDKKNVTFRIV